MNWLRTRVVVIAAGLLLGLSATVAAQRPTEGTAGGGGGGGGAPASGAGGSAAGSGGGSPSIGAMSSGGSSGGSSFSGGSGGWNGPSTTGGSYPGGASLARPRDEVFQRPGFADVYGSRVIGRNESAPATGAEAPWYSRPRGDTPSSGTAMLRTDYIASHPPGGGGGDNPGWGGGYYPGYPGYPGYYPGYGYGGYYGWYMYPWSWNSYGYGYPDCGYGGYGMGYFYYNPFGWNYYGNCGYYGSGMYGAEYGGYGPSYGSGGSVGYGQYQSRGGLRLKVKPTNARVYVDGYYAGKVDQFDGSFQKLEIERGTHKIEISALGYAPVVFEIEIKAYETITWEGNLEKIVERIK